MKEASYNDYKELQRETVVCVWPKTLERIPQHRRRTKSVEISFVQQRLVRQDRWEPRLLHAKAGPRQRTV